MKGMGTGAHSDGVRFLDIFIGNRDRLTHYHPVASHR